jgi:hypothetical protein
MLTQHRKCGTLGAGRIRPSSSMTTLMEHKKWGRPADAEISKSSSITMLTSTRSGEERRRSIFQYTHQCRFCPAQHAAKSGGRSHFAFPINNNAEESQEVVKGVGPSYAILTNNDAAQHKSRRRVADVQISKSSPMTILAQLKK